MEHAVNETEMLRLARVAVLMAVARDTASSLQLVSSQLQAELSRHDPSTAPEDPVLDRVAEVQALNEEVDQLRQALESRAVIEQAKGILMARCGCDADTAFGMLCTLSRTERRKVRDVAVTIVTGAVVHQPSTPR